MNNREKGKLWEMKASAYLELKGYRIMFRNWTCRWGEIDIVAYDTKNRVMVFVEVKYRDGWLGDAHEAVGFYKMRSLKRSAGFFIQKEMHTSEEYRFDLVAITKLRGQIKIEHFESI